MTHDMVFGGWLPSYLKLPFLPVHIHAYSGHKSCSWCYKTFFGGILDFPKIKKLKNIISDVWIWTKILKQCSY